MEQLGVGEHPVEVRFGQFHLQEILPPDFASAVGARHVGQGWSPLEADGAVPPLRECPQVAPGTAAQVQYRAWRACPNVAEQSLDVLLDVVVASALPESRSAAVVVLECAADDLPQGVCIEYVG